MKHTPSLACASQQPCGEKRNVFEVGARVQCEATIASVHRSRGRSKTARGFQSWARVQLSSNRRGFGGTAAPDSPGAAGLPIIQSASDPRFNTLKRFQGILPESQGQNLTSAVLYVQCWLDCEKRENKIAPGLGREGDVHSFVTINR